MKKIAIIGGGWSGIGCLRMLLENGHDVHLYEKNDDIGGTWHPSNCYASLKMHSTSKQVQYFDFPLPENIDVAERMTSAQIFSYLQDYCQTKNFYQYMTFNIEVIKCSYNTKTNKITIDCYQVINKQFSSHIYDYVINTHGFTDRNIPEFKGKDLFLAAQGSILHAFDVTEKKLASLVLENKKITVLGSSKTAADFVLNIYKYSGYKFTWLYRSPYWFIRFDPLRSIISKKISGKRFINSLYFLSVSLGLLISSKLPKIHFWLWRTTGVIKTFGKKHSDFRKFHFGFLDDQEILNLKKINSRQGVVGEINALEKGGIRLKDGRFIESEVIICGTGTSNKTKIALEVDGLPLSLNQVYAAYRAMVIPQIPPLIFTSYVHFGLGTVNALNKGNWIVEYIKANLSIEYLTKNATKYPFPFFLRYLAFSSSENMFISHERMVKPFFDNKELERETYAKWYILEYYFGKKSALPVKFKPPLKLKEK